MKDEGRGTPTSNAMADAKPQRLRAEFQGSGLRLRVCGLSAIFVYINLALIVLRPPVSLPVCTRVCVREVCMGGRVFPKA